MHGVLHGARVGVGWPDVRRDFTYVYMRAPDECMVSDLFFLTEILPIF